MSITVSEALSLIELRDCKLVAGKSGLENRISLVDVMEIPDIAPWLRRHELVVTTGYSIHTFPNALVGLIHALYETDSAGLAIKTRFLGDIPQEAISLANELAIPIIVIPAEITLADITNPIIKAIVDRQSIRLEFSEEIHRKFAELELSGGGMRPLVKMLGQLLHMPLAITDTSFKPLAMEADAASGHLLGKMMHDISEEHGQIDSPYLQRYESGWLMIRTIRMKNSICGYIFLLNSALTLDDMQMIILDHAVTAVALEFSKLEVLDEHLRQMGSSFFMDLLLKNIKSEEMANYRAKYLHWPMLPVCVAVLDMDGFSEYVSQNSELEILEAKQKVERIIAEEFPTAAIISKSDSFTCILSDKVEKKELTAGLYRIRRRSQTALHLSFTAGVVRGITSYIGLSEAFAEARDAIRISRCNEEYPSVVCIENMRIDQALLHSDNNPYLKKLCLETVRRLEEYDQEHHTELLKTLRVLIKNMGVRTQTAEELFLHRNTLLYRIRKIEQLLDCNLSDSDELIKLAIILRAKVYF